MGRIIATLGIMILVTTFLAVGCAQPTTPPDDGRIAELEAEIAQLKAALSAFQAKSDLQKTVEALRTQAKARMAQDLERYSATELKEIESLYQVANRNWKTTEAKESLEALLAKYDGANRTGCALLYLSQMSDGAEREKYLKRAIADFSDCFYGDGVQVGAYSRYLLAHHYSEEGKAAEAKALFAEVASKYPMAIDHKGKFLTDPSAK
jgi:hypothetical protein